MANVAHSTEPRNNFPPFTPQQRAKIERLKAAAIAEMEAEERKEMQSATKTHDQRKPARNVKRPHLNVVPALPRTFKTQEALDRALRDLIAQRGNLNSERKFEINGICNPSKSDDHALIFDPVTSDVTCKEGCEYKAILRAFNLPEQPQADTADMLYDISEKLHISIKQIIQLGDDEDATFDIKLHNGTQFSLGKAEHVFNITKVEAKIAAATHVTIPPFSKKEWRMLAAFVFESATVVKTVSLNDETRSCIEAFTSSSSIRGEHQEAWTQPMPRIDYKDKQVLFRVLNAIKDTKHQTNSPGSKGFIDESDQRGYLSIEALKHFANFNGYFGGRINLPELAQRLRREGFTPKQIPARQGDDVVSVSLWRSPAKYRGIASRRNRKTRSDSEQE